MQFGHFSYHITRTGRAGDARAIEEALAEARLAEQLGYDAVWFSEHHFTGETVYADPVMFATAVAMQTERVKLGFAVLEMALYHPVRLAEQLALLDNLSRGRVIVGIARGSAFNAYEYRGFGTSVQFGRECLDEAEELLIKCWTARDGLEFRGQYWDVALPEVRPHPVQQPHPPVLRAAVGPPAVRQMAAQRRPGADAHVFPRRQRAKPCSSIPTRCARLAVTKSQVRDLLEQCWIWRDCYVADSDTEARAGFLPAPHLLAGVRQHDPRALEPSRSRTRRCVRRTCRCRRRRTGSIPIRPPPELFRRRAGTGGGADRPAPGTGHTGG